ncbi:hypothetical protein ACFQY0_09015 [Haloferula chungangensis]|uniref:Uncharacterized protein n=1 Tax=Haloferula chungangensis TaxID=1048331 RepID=A0ABW2L6P5_9BACT
MTPRSIKRRAMHYIHPSSNSLLDRTRETIGNVDISTRSLVMISLVASIGAGVTYYLLSRHSAERRLEPRREDSYLDETEEELE